jgi:hypothetical protein
MCRPKLWGILQTWVWNVKQDSVGRTDKKLSFGGSAVLFSSSFGKQGQSDWCADHFGRVSNFGRTFSRAVQNSSFAEASVGRIAVGRDMYSTTASGALAVLRL